MMRAMRRAAVVGCIGLIGGAAYLYWDPLHPTQPQQKQQNQPRGGPALRRGGGSPNDAVPVLTVSAQAVVGMLFGLLALFLGWPSAPLLGLVVVAGVTCYLVARHFFDAQHGGGGAG